MAGGVIVGQPELMPSTNSNTVEVDQPSGGLMTCCLAHDEPGRSPAVGPEKKTYACSLEMVAANNAVQPPYGKGRGTTGAGKWAKSADVGDVSL